MPVVLLWQLCLLDTNTSRIAFMKKHEDNHRFMQLVWFSANSGLAFRNTNIVALPRPKAPTDTSREFISKVERLIKHPFDEDVIKDVEAFITDMEESDPLSAYIYALVLNKQLQVTQDTFNKVWPDAIRTEPFELTNTYGSPEFPCICQILPKKYVEVIITNDARGTYLKDKGGCPVGGFENYLEYVHSIGIYGDFNALITGSNIPIYINNIKGGSEVADNITPILITDVQMPLVLSVRLSMIESALIAELGDTEGKGLVTTVTSVVANSIEDVINYAKHSNNVGNKIVARQDTLPILWTIGNHNIDISKHVQALSIL